MPQMFVIYFFLFISSLIEGYSEKPSRLKGKYRIGPHNKDILSIIFGSLLGDGHAEKRQSGTGTRITFYQESSHLKYIFYLHDLLSRSGYCNIKQPEIGTRLGIGGKVRKTVRFAT
jgi:ubiquinol-cytochrome c reductase cytochrome b subunit